jgi:iron-sulfur cluster repair protein YtfE (RIC family)
MPSGRARAQRLREAKGDPPASRLARRLLFSRSEDAMDATVELLLRDGRLIESLQQLVDRYVGEHSGAPAEEVLAALTDRLRSRIRLEEERLFPRIERLVGDPRFALTERMRRQHAVLLDLVAGIEAALRRNDFDAAAGDLRELKAALHTHLEEERRVLLPIVGVPASGHA